MKITIEQANRLLKERCVKIVCDDTMPLDWKLDFLETQVELTRKALAGQEWAVALVLAHD